MLIGCLLTSCCNRTIFRVYTCLVEVCFFNLDMVGEGGVADQFDPVTTILVVDNCLNHSARIVNGNWFIEGSLVTMQKDKG